MNRVPTKTLVPVLLVLATTALSGCIAEDLMDSASSGKSAHKHQDPQHWRDHRAHDHDPHHGHEYEGRKDPAEAYSDGSPRYSNTLDGEETSRRTVNVPLGTHTLRVALIHDTHAEAMFSLYDPTHLLDPGIVSKGDPVASEHVDGDKYMDEPEWVIVHNPMPGDWVLDICIHGLSSYTVSFYLD